MSNPKENSKPVKDEGASPNPATGRTEVSTNTVVEDFTNAPAVNPYDHKVEVKTSKLGDGTVVESYE